MRKAWIALVVGALVLAACGGGSEEADDTPAPGATPTTAMSGGGGGGHTHGGEGEDCSPSGTTVSVIASGTKFNTHCLAAPANQQFTLSYENKDSIGHNIVFLESHTATQTMFKADIFRGPDTKTFSVGPFKAGKYAFHCEVHPSVMEGTFVVK